MANTFDQLVQVYNDTIVSLNPNIATNIQGTDIYFKANAVAQVATNVVQDIQVLQNNIIPASSSGTFLDRFAGSLGMTPRQAALPSQGNLSTVVANSGSTAAAATVIPVGTQLVSSTTNQVYNVTQSVSIANGATLANVVIPVQSVNLGAGTNSPPNDILNFVTPFPVGATSQTLVSAAVVSTGMTAGSDTESDNSFALRIFTFMVNPRGGGSSGDYISWCFLGSPNVTQASVITTFQVNSNLLFPIIFEGSPDGNFYIDGNANNNFLPTPAPINRSAPSLDIANVQEYITGVRPINDNPNVLTVSTYELSGTDPIFGNGSYFNVNVILTPGLTLSTDIATTNGNFLTVEELILREFRRAIILTEPNGTSLTIGGITNNYIVVTSIEDLIMIGLGNTATIQGNYGALILSLQIEYHAQGSGTSTYFVPIPSLASDNLFTIVDNIQQALLVYDINTSMINVNLVS